MVRVLLNPFVSAATPVRRVARAACAATLIIVAGCGSPEPPPAATAAPVERPLRLYVSDETGGNIVVIDAASGEILQRAAVGKRPRGIRVSRDGTSLLVALSGSPIAGPGVDASKLPPPDRAADGIGVVSLPAMTVLKTLESGPDPETFDASLDGRLAFVSNEDAAKMTAIDVVTGEIRAEVPVGGEPEGVKVRPDGRVVYITCEETSEVFAIDTTTFAVVARIKVGARPRDIVFTPDSALGFVTDENDGTISVIETKNHTVTKAIAFPAPASADAIPARPMSAVLSPDARHLYVSLGRARSVGVIDVATLAFSRTIDDVGVRPWGIDISPDGRTLFTANGPSGDVSIIDIASGTVRTRVATGGSPWGVVVGPGR
jgi:YVTN family beta-propeller protein